MISALDTSVLLDVFLPDPTHMEGSRVAIRDSFAAGALVICEPVYAELASRFSRQAALDEILKKSRIRVEPVGQEAAFLAGRMFHQYRDAGGKRDRIITDFLVGGHAARRAARLVTRDRGFYRKYFEGLIIVDPTASKQQSS